MKKIILLPIISFGILFLGNAQSSKKYSTREDLIISLLIENNKQITDIRKEMVDMRKEMVDMRKEFQQQREADRKEFQQQREADRKEFKQDIGSLESKMDNIILYIFGTLFLGIIGFFTSMFKEELKPRIKRFFSMHKTSEVKTSTEHTIDPKLVTSLS